MVSLIGADVTMKRCLLMPSKGTLARHFILALVLELSNRLR